MRFLVLKKGKGGPVSTFLFGLLLAAGLVTAGLAVLSLTAPRPSSLGVRDGRLADCPASPNCVSTQADDTSHWMKPLSFDCDPATVIPVLRQVLTQMPRCSVVKESANYLHVEFRSQLFRFVDDVEFLVEPESGRIHFRSASRVGHSDMGVNRGRMDLIRREFQKAQEQAAALQAEGHRSSSQPVRSSRRQSVPSA